VVRSGDIGVEIYTADGSKHMELIDSAVLVGEIMADVHAKSRVTGSSHFWSLFEENPVTGIVLLSFFGIIF